MDIVVFGSCVQDLIRFDGTIYSKVIDDQLLAIRQDFQILENQYAAESSMPAPVGRELTRQLLQLSSVQK